MTIMSDCCANKTAACNYQFKHRFKSMPDIEEMSQTTMYSDLSLL